MARTRPQSVSRTDTQPETALVLSFAGRTDGRERRIRYLVQPGTETMWRLDERRQDGDWQIIDAEPIEDLQLSLSNSPPKPERHTDLTV